MKRSQLYQKHLDRVSRSFAYCIARLDGSFKNWVGLSYLICRILDTVEDAPWKEKGKQQEKFKGFDRFLVNETSENEIEQWAQGFPDDIPAGEKKLLRDAATIFQDIHSAPQAVKAAIQQMVGSMSSGMQYFSELTKDKEVRLKSLAEVNQYCFFVAGVVGEMLANIFSAVDERAKLTKSNLVNAHHFGLFLQKVNLLKDQMVDETEGRFLIPSRPVVFESLKENSQGAIAYIKSLPQDQKGYRLFCAWSFFLGMASLPLIKDSYGKKAKPKFSRIKTIQLFHKIETVIDDDNELEKLYVQFLGQISFDNVNLAFNIEASSDFISSYKGALTSAEMRVLRLI